jgi:hypothetical protein
MPFYIKSGIKLTFFSSLCINDMVTLTAPQLHPSLTSHFFIDYTMRVVIEGFSLKSSFRSLLTASSQSNLSRHVDIVHLYYGQKDSKVFTDSYVFSHPKLRPWGQWLPISCPSCSSLHSWSDPTRNQSTIIFACKRPNCSALCTFRKPEGVELVGKEVNEGRWMVKSGQC